MVIWPPSRRNLELLPGVHQGEQVLRAFERAIDTVSRLAPGSVIGETLLIGNLSGACSRRRRR
jgi:hypothetical protein